jgi:hypothetical protein
VRAGRRSPQAFGLPQPGGVEQGEHGRPDRRVDGDPAASGRIWFRVASCSGRLRMPGAGGADGVLGAGAQVLPQVHGRDRQVAHPVGVGVGEAQHRTGEVRAFLAHDRRLALSLGAGAGLPHGARGRPTGGQGNPDDVLA